MSSGIIPASAIIRVLPMLDVECKRCGRKGRYRSADLFRDHGPQWEQVAEWLTRDCPHREEMRWGARCAVLMVDLAKYF